MGGAQVKRKGGRCQINEDRWVWPGGRGLVNDGLVGVARRRPVGVASRVIRVVWAEPSGLRSGVLCNHHLVMCIPFRN